MTTTDTLNNDNGGTVDNLKQNASHLIMAAIAIGAVCALAATGAITGGEALGIIGSVAGVSVGGSVASSSSSGTTAAPAGTVNVPVKVTTSSSPSNSLPTNGSTDVVKLGDAVALVTPPANV